MKGETIKAASEAIGGIAEMLNLGKVGVIPTDTVYGLAAHPRHAQSVERLYSITMRSEKKPIALLASSIAAIESFGFALNGKAKELAQRFWPGALTLIIENSKGETEGFRIPNHDWTLRLIEKCGGVLRVTSANISGGKDATNADEALAQIGLEADFVVDDGPSKGGIASTVAKVSHSGEITILRQGAISIL